MYIYIYIYIRDVHLHNWGRCETHLDAKPTIWYIEDSYEAASDAMFYTIYPYYDAVWFDFDLTQCDSMQWKKYDCFYFFGSEKQQIINWL